MAAKIPQVVGNLPSPPNPADRSTFNTLAYPWSEALTPWTNEMNQLAADTYDNALDVQGASTVTGSDRDIALGAANAASVDAGLANGYKNEAFVSKQSASASAGLADASRSDAQMAALAAAAWATSTTAVSGGNKGAKGYALDAAQSAADAASIVLGEVFDNTQESAVKGWTSSKIVAWFNGLTTTFTRTLLTRTNAAQARTDLGLGYAATAPTVGGGVDVMRVGAGGWLGRGEALSVPYGYPESLDDVTNQTKVIRTSAIDNEVPAYATGIHVAASDTWGRLRFAHNTQKAWLQGGHALSGTGWTSQVVLSANMLQAAGTSTDFPMSQKATTDAIANIPSVPKSAAYTVTAADKGKSIDTTTNVTIPASVFAVGDVIVVTNTSATNSTITPAAGVTIRLAGTTSTGARTLAGYGVATLRMASNNVWFASGAGLT